MSIDVSPLFAVFGIGPTEMIIVGIIAVLLFGKRVPEVARSLGKGVTEFKKGIQGVEEEFRSSASNTASSSSRSTRYSDVDDRDEATAPKFEPPKTEPTNA
ncbi:MAG: twin-arginine translocase TatA/TatE family subunit [Planctomycetes bacterium]|nr:twin-arginine translocase TatA/TatE family subunit [Planctomycetota bacterium]